MCPEWVFQSGSRSFRSPTSQASPLGQARSFLSRDFLPRRPRSEYRPIHASAWLSLPTHRRRRPSDLQQTVPVPPVSFRSSLSCPSRLGNAAVYRSSFFSLFGNIVYLSQKDHDPNSKSKLSREGTMFGECILYLHPLSHTHYTISTA